MPPITPISTAPATATPNSLYIDQESGEIASATHTLATTIFGSFPPAPPSTPVETPAETPSSPLSQRVGRLCSPSTRYPS